MSKIEGIKEFELMRLKGEIIYPEKDLIVTYALWFFLGAFGVHRMYLGYTKTGVLMLILTISVIGSPISAVWWLIDAYLNYVNINEINLSAKLNQIEILENISDN